MSRFFVVTARRASSENPTCGASASSNGMRREHNVYILNGMDTVEGFSSQSVVNAAPTRGSLAISQL